MKKIFSEKKGFTLLELLIVMAVIVILVAVIIAGISSSRDKSRKASAQQTMKSVLPFAADCYMRGKSIPATPAAGNRICDDTNITFPAFDAKTGWAYTSSTSNFEYKAWNTNNHAQTITCKPEESRCVTQ